MFRAPIANDRAFFAAGWLRSYKSRGSTVKGVHAKTYNDFQQRLIQRLVRRGEVIMAVDPAAPERTLFGFACFERLRGTCVLHYVYVRGVCRGNGIGSALVRECLRAFEPEAARALAWTHRTSGFDSWIRQFADRERPNLPLLYNPYLTDPENHTR